MSKILLALQYWGGDRAMAMKLARTIADLEHRHCDKADFLFMSRFDCQHDMATEQYVGRKFNVWSATCRRRADGWPFACNALWFGTMDWVYTMMEAKKIPQYKAVLTFEADSCPLIPGWINSLSQVWDDAQKIRPTYVYGAMLLYPKLHINGNALFSCDRKFLHWLTRSICDVNPAGGWDYILAPKFKEWGWGDCPQIKSYWRSPSITEELFTEEAARGVSFLHGVKDMSAIETCRRRYSLPPV